MSFLKKISRKTIIPLIYNLGFHKYKINNNFILCYHGVSSNPNFEINNRHIHINEFEKNLIYLTKNFQIVPLNEIFEDYKNDIHSKKPKVALSFDDGYLNNITTALPLLEKYNAFATFFIVSNSLEDNHFILWPDIIEIAIYSNKLDSLIFNNIDFFNNEITDYIKKMGAEREIALENFKNKYIQKNVIQENKEYLKLINKDDLKKLSKNRLIEIGSHTHLHYNLGNINIDLAEKELVYSKNLIEEIIQKDVITIAFPDGNYNEDIKNLSEKIGYKNLCAVNYNLPNDKNDKRILNRFMISNSTTHESNIIRLSLSF
jgi:peptidoglycan/xylan/chitin deacetylase (PgdA/CDA1 family)